MISKKCKGCLSAGDSCNHCRRKSGNARYDDHYHGQANIIHQKARMRGMGIACKDTGHGGPRDVLPSYTRKELKKLKIKTVEEATDKNKYYPVKRERKSKRRYRKLEK